MVSNMKINNKGFTLIELMGVIVIILLMSVMAINTYNKISVKNEQKVFIDEAITISEGAQNKYADDRLNKDYSQDLYNGKVDGKYCYSIEYSLKNKFIRKYDSDYVGSVEVCPDCDVKTKMWLTDGEYYINGANPLTVKRSNLTKNPTGQNYSQCGRTTISANEVFAFDYSGKEQIFITPKAGRYKLEVWGAQGGNLVNVKDGGYGGYSVGTVSLKKEQVLFINVGGRGNDDSNMAKTGSYNGGGQNAVVTVGYSNVGGGGGATSIALKSGTLPNLKTQKNYVLIVAGGGGGAGAYGSPGSGGGINGGENPKSVKASQVNGYAFGQGENTISACGCHTAGAGGGYYGASHTDNCGCPSAGGGSGFINYSGMSSAHMYGYNVDTSDEVGSVTLSGTNKSETPTADYAKIGDGYAKITYLGS